MGRRGWRRGAATLTVAVTAALGLGLMVPTGAGASCAGPQVALEQSGNPVVSRRVGQDLDEKILHDVSRKRPLLVKGSNLTFECNDTGAVTRTGCGAPAPRPVEPPEPMRDPQVILEQNGRTWTLGPLGPVGADLTAQAEVELPPAVQPGAAVLAVLDWDGSGPELDLVVG